MLSRNTDSKNFYWFIFLFFARLAFLCFAFLYLFFDILWNKTRAIIIIPIIDKSSQRLLLLVANNFPTTAPVTAFKPPFFGNGVSAVTLDGASVAVFKADNFVSVGVVIGVSALTSQTLLVSGGFDSSGHLVL